VKASMDCKKLYVNVYSSSPEEDGAMICCNDYLDEWLQLFSYEGFLCNSKVSFFHFVTNLYFLHKNNQY